MRCILIALLLMAACKKSAPSEDATPVDPIVFDSAADRMLAMSDDGWIVSRGTNGVIEHQGDSLLWTGLALGALDCERAAKPGAALLAMLDTTGGRLWRHPSLPDDWSLDGAIGLYAGILEHVKRCPASQANWAAALAKHAATKPSLPPRFQTLLDASLASLGVGSMPSAADRGALASECVGWAVGVVGEKAAGYRLHLCYLTLGAFAAPNGRAAWCAAVEDAKMPLLEHFCGRPGLAAWLSNFHYDVWEYAHQRAAWETPDGAGLTTPGLDYLTAARALEAE